MLPESLAWEVERKSSFIIAKISRFDQRTSASGSVGARDQANVLIYGEFDSGSERTLAAWIRHASRALVIL